MKESISYRKRLSIFLIIVFINPLLIKGTHFLYVHHESHHISHTDKPEVYSKHKKCLICSFEFVEFITNKKPQITGKPRVYSVYYPIIIQGADIPGFRYSFNLRAPPVK